MTLAIAAVKLFLTGCPWQNPYVESFHGHLRDECLNLHHFAMLLEAKVVIDDWRAEYNTVRPHSGFLRAGGLG
jgi:putative transposase